MSDNNKLINRGAFAFFSLYPLSSSTEQLLGSRAW